MMGVLGLEGSFCPSGFPFCLRWMPERLHTGCWIQSLRCVSHSPQNCSRCWPEMWQLLTHCA